MIKLNKSVKNTSPDKVTDYEIKIWNDIFKTYILS